MLYNHKTSEPSSKSTASEGALPVYSATEATANCNVLEVVLIQPDQKESMLSPL